MIVATFCVFHLGRRKIRVTQMKESIVAGGCVAVVVARIRKLPIVIMAGKEEGGVSRLCASLHALCSSVRQTRIQFRRSMMMITDEGCDNEGDDADRSTMLVLAMCRRSTQWWWWGYA